MADQAAHTAAKTPTACAAALVAHVAAFDERLATARSVLRLLAERRLARPRAWLGEARLRLGHHTQRHCHTAAGKLAGARRSLQRSHAHVQRGTVSLRALRPRLERASARRLGTAKAQLRSASALVSAVAPERTLARGFSITRAADGSIVRDMPPTGDTIVTETARARFASTVSAEASAPAGKPTTETADLRD